MDVQNVVEIRQLIHKTSKILMLIKNHNCVEKM